MSALRQGSQGEMKRKEMDPMNEAQG